MTFDNFSDLDIAITLPRLCRSPDTVRNEMGRLHAHNDARDFNLTAWELAMIARCGASEIERYTRKVV